MNIDKVQIKEEKKDVQLDEEYEENSQEYSRSSDEPKQEKKIKEETWELLKTFGVNREFVEK